MQFSQVWSLILLTAYLTFPRLSAKWKITGVKSAWLIVMGVALIVRLLPALILPVGAGYDIESYQIVGDLMEQGKDVYTSPETEKRHPYLPFQMYWLASARAIAKTEQISFAKTVKIEPILADVGIALILFASLLRSSRTSPAANLKLAFLGGMLYALNPIPIFVSAYHGQFDAVPALFILCSFFWLSSAPWLSGIWLGLGILSKSWPVLALPSLLTGVVGWRKRVSFLVLAGIIPLAGVFFYASIFKTDPASIISRAVGYNWGIGIWGYTIFIKLLSYFQPSTMGLFNWFVTFARFITLAGLGLAWWFRARKESPQGGFLTILIAFFAITHAFSIQYLMWIVPFAILSLDLKWLKVYTIAAFIYMFLAYNTLILEMHITNILPWPEADLFIIRPVGLLPWIVCVVWALDRIVQAGWKDKVLNRLGISKANQPV
jgi:hypothetical protein